MELCAPPLEQETDSVIAMFGTAHLFTTASARIGNSFDLPVNAAVFTNSLFST